MFMLCKYSVISTLYSSVLLAPEKAQINDVMSVFDTITLLFALSIPKLFCFGFTRKKKPACESQ